MGQGDTAGMGALLDTPCKVEVRVKEQFLFFCLFWAFPPSFTLHFGTVSFPLFPLGGKSLRWAPGLAYVSPGLGSSVSRGWGCYGSFRSMPSPDLTPACPFCDSSHVGSPSSMRQESWRFSCQAGATQGWTFPSGVKSLSPPLEWEVWNTLWPLRCLPKGHSIGG